MKYNLLKPCGFTLLVFLAKFQLIFGDIPAQSGTQLFLHRFSDDAENDNAVCNDGTKGGYYFSPASLAEANDTFVIHLPGGGQCYDEDSCNKRWKFKAISMSSTNFTASKFKKGLMDNSIKKTPFWSANKVMLGYCSSDGYMGDVAASKETWGWHFRGQQLVFAMIRDLIANKKLSSTSTIVFSGGSAGARGVMVLIDILVADYFPKGAKIVGFLDSPYYIDVPPFSPLYKGFQYEESMKFKHMNTKNIVSPECADSYPSEQWKCQFGQYRMPFVKTSYFLMSSQYDSYQLQMNTQTVPPYSKSATDYVTRFGSTLHNSLIFLRNLKMRESTIKRGVSATYAFYSWTCYNHEVGTSSEFYTMAVDEGVTPKDALEAFLKSSLVVYSAAKGVAGSEYASSGVTVSSVGAKGSKGKKEKSFEAKVKHANMESFESGDKISHTGMIDEGNGAIVKKALERLTTVHSWVDSCTGMNCGSSCSAQPVTKSTTAARDKDRMVKDGQYDIQSMGGKSAQTIGKKDKMLAQYNAESDSEEDDDNDDRPLFMPLTQHILSHAASSDAAAASVLAPLPIPPINSDAVFIDKSVKVKVSGPATAVASAAAPLAAINSDNTEAVPVEVRATDVATDELQSSRVILSTAPKLFAVSLYSPLVVSSPTLSSAVGE